MKNNNNNICKNYARFKKIKSCKGNFKKLKANSVCFKNLTLSNLIFNTSSQNFTVTNLSSQNIIVNNLSAQNLTVTNFSAQNLTVTNFSSQNINVNNLSAQNLTVTNFSAQNITASYLYGNVTNGNLYNGYITNRYLYLTTSSYTVTTTNPNTFVNYYVFKAPNPSITFQPFTSIYDGISLYFLNVDSNHTFNFSTTGNDVIMTKTGAVVTNHDISIQKNHLLTLFCIWNISRLEIYETNSV